MRTQFFRMHYLLTLGILSVFLVISFFANHLIMTVSAPPPWRSNPVVFIAKMMEAINPLDRISAIQKLESVGTDGLPMKLMLVSEDGEVLYPSGRSLSVDWKTLEKPKTPFEWTTLEKQKEKGSAKSFGPPGAPGPALVRLPGEPVQYLFHEFDDKGHGPGPMMFFVTFGLLILSVMLGVGLSQFILFRVLRQKVKLADSVISELQRGNLKARFPIQKMDEFGMAMSRFNKMANEIERLVEHLKSTETSRTTLLQELTHDLRTPIASVKNLLENLDTRGISLSPDIHKEFTSLALKEIHYFERLVEDLLVLSQVSEPKYDANRDLVSVTTILDDEIESARSQANADDKGIEVNINLPDYPAEISGDQHLLRRLFRNALNNAFSFARTRIDISLSMNSNGDVDVCIQDDGPGLSSDALTSFGNRRITRALDVTFGGRLSIGLGSVIMKSIAQTHRGEVSIANVKTSNGEIHGAKLSIRLSA